MQISVYDKLNFFKSAMSSASRSVKFSIYQGSRVSVTKKKKVCKSLLLKIANLIFHNVLIFLIISINAFFIFFSATSAWQRQNPSCFGFIDRLIFVRWGNLKWLAASGPLSPTYEGLVDRTFSRALERRVDIFSCVILLNQKVRPLKASISFRLSPLEQSFKF